MSAHAPSTSLLRAATAETGRIDRALGVLHQRQAALRAELARLDAEAGELEARRGLLGQLTAGETATSAGPAPAGPAASRALKGRELRRVAGALLWHTHGDREVHYREWFERVLAAGYAVGGKDPAASFLTNIRDSPAVARGERPGYYRLDPSSRARARQAIAELAAEQRDVSGVLERARQERAPAERIDELREHRDRLSQRLRRAEADTEELDAIFADAKPADAGEPALRAA